MNNNHYEPTETNEETEQEKYEKELNRIQSLPAKERFGVFAVGIVKNWKVDWHHETNRYDN